MRQWTADEGNAAVAKRCQMLHSLADSLCVVHLEDVNIRQDGAGIHKDQRKLALHQLLYQILFDAESHYRNAVHIALQQAPHEALSAGRVVVG